jgi:hypothetical protein
LKPSPKAESSFGTRGGRLLPKAAAAQPFRLYFLKEVLLFSEFPGRARGAGGPN